MLAFSVFYPAMLRDKHLPFGGAMIGFVWHALLAAVVAIAVLLTLAARRWWVFRNQPNFPDPERIPRLIVNPWILRCVIVVGMVGGGLFACRSTIGRWPWDDFFFSLAIPIAAGAAVVLPIIGTYFRKELAAGLHIVMDIIAHFYERGLRFPWPFGKPPAMNIESFVVEMRVEARLRRVLQEILFRIDGQVSDFTIVAHSQGSMIAINTLWLAWTHRLLKQNPRHPDIKVRFVTMGSPFTYLYQHYYPARYPNLFDIHGHMNRSWVPKTQVWLEDMTLDKTVQEWLNLYRVDDFVGTKIQGGSPNFPENAHVGAGGHTYYWHQAEVLARLGPFMPG
jgi:hypothetical protein